MSFVIGALCLLAAGWFVVQGRKFSAMGKAEEARIEAARAAGEDKPHGDQLHPSLGALVLIVPGLVKMFVALFGLLIAIAWFAVGRGTFFTLFDLIGFLVGLAAFGYWLGARTLVHQVKLDVSAKAS